MSNPPLFLAVGGQPQTRQNVVVLKRFIIFAVLKQKTMAKAKMNYEDAINLLYKKVGETHFEDVLYEVAWGLLRKYINEIEEKNRIVDNDGEFCDYNSGAESMWYDEVYDELMWPVLDGIQSAGKE